MKTIHGRFLSFTLLVLISACSTGPNIITATYSPMTTSEIKGNVEVRQFEYSSKFYGQNYLPSSGAYLSENIDSYFTNALKRELTQAKTNVVQKAQCRISGSILELSLWNRPFGSGDYKSKIRYNLKLDNLRPVYANIIDVEYHGTNDLRENISKVFSDNIKQLLNDPDFQVAFKEWCAAPAMNTQGAVQDSSQTIIQVGEPQKRASKK